MKADGVFNINKLDLNDLTVSKLFFIIPGVLERSKTKCTKPRDKNAFMMKGRKCERQQGSTKRGWSVTIEQFFTNDVLYIYESIKYYPS